MALYCLSLVAVQELECELGDLQSKMEGIHGKITQTEEVLVAQNKEMESLQQRLSHTVLEVRKHYSHIVHTTSDYQSICMCIHMYFLLFHVLQNSALKASQEEEVKVNPFHYSRSCVTDVVHLFLL